MRSCLFGGSKPPPYEKFVRIFEVLGETCPGGAEKKKKKKRMFPEGVFIYDERGHSLLA